MAERLVTAPENQVVGHTVLGEHGMEMGVGMETLLEVLFGFGAHRQLNCKMELGVIGT